MESIRSIGSFVPRRKSSVYHVNGRYVDKINALKDESDLFTAKRLLLCVWMCVGVVPLILQARSYAKFMAPHKITQDLVVPDGTAIETINLHELCPVKGLMVAGAWWNVAVTHYYTIPDAKLCHFVVPQYNIHGTYLLETEKVAPSPTTPSSCSNESFAFHHYFYHGSIGYYAFYEEASGTYCSIDETAYVEVNGLGTYDSNGSHLAKDTGDTTYRRSYWCNEAANASSPAGRRSSAVAACRPELVVGVAIFRHVRATSSSRTLVLFIIQIQTRSYAKLRLVVLTLPTHPQPAG